MEAACSVCFVPHGSAPRPACVVAGIQEEDTAAAILGAAAAICRSFGGCELVAVRTWLGWTMDPSGAALDRMREQEWLEMFRFLNRADLQGVDCTPRIEESSRFSTGVLRVARERGAELVVAAAPEPGWVSLPDRRPGQEDLLFRCPLPLLLLRAGSAKHRSRGILRRLFAREEPAFA
jgi:hypothetical protein